MRSRSVLLVDADTAVLRAVERIIHKYKRCICAASIAQAREALAVEQLCGLVVDATLHTNGDGLHFMTEFRAQYPNAPILVLTATAAAETLRAAFYADAPVIIKGTAAHPLDSFAKACVVADLDHLDRLPTIREVLADWVRRSELTVKELEVLEGAVAGRRGSWFEQNCNLSSFAYRARVRSLLPKIGFVSLEEAVLAILTEACRRASTLEIAV